jgi:hypothetical protein
MAHVANSGSFAKGNKKGAGNSEVRRMAKYRQSIRSAISQDDVQYLALRMLEQAMQGDVAAARLILEYTCGKPKQPVELTGKDGGPIQHSLPLIVEIVVSSRDEIAATEELVTSGRIGSYISDS